MLTCPHCLTPLEEGAAGGLCPSCLLKRGLEVHTAAAPWQPPSIEELAPPFPELDLLNFLGRGGMGAVYKARQKSLDRIVALKILPPEISRDPAFASRFTREAQAMARLHHPNIVTLFEFGERKIPEGSPALAAPALFYFLMEFVDGISLRQLINSGTVATTDALAIVPQICDALQYAHDRGIVHRDIKPENILLARGGQIKIADFGVAKLQHGGETDALTPAGASSVMTTTLAGTPAYMAPEQSSSPGGVDNRADIYSLGVVFYQLLTGEMPKSGAFVPPSRKVAIDVRVDEIVIKALERSPTLRYQQVSEVKADVVTMLQRGAQPPAAPTAASVAQQFRPPQAENPGRNRLERIGLIAAIICLLAMLLGFVIYEVVRPPQGRAPAAPPSAAIAGGGIETPLVPAVSALAGAYQDFRSNVWTDLINGCVTDHSRDEIRIHGITDKQGWNHWNGVISAASVPDGDFTISVDIRIAKFAGDTQYKNPYMRVEAADASAIGIFANPDFFYRLHDWKDPQTMSSTHALFGDEAFKYHRMTLKWENAQGIATGLVDGELIGTIHTALGSGRKLMLVINTETKGMDIDVYFKNLKVDFPDPPGAGN